MKEFVRLKNLVNVHDDWYADMCVNLCAAESVMSPAARKLMSSYLANRACSGAIGVRHHGGLQTVDEIDSIVVQTAKELFQCKFVDYQPLSASQGNCIAVRVMTDVGDSVMALPAPSLGHDTWREKGASGHRGLKLTDVPIDKDSREIDIEAFADQCRRIRPRAVFLGHASFVFPHPIQEMSKITDEIGAKILYDGAHVVGLISGGQFQDPLAEGAAMLTGCTMKTMSGPLGGLLLYNDEALDKKIKEVHHGYIAGYNPARIAALAVTLLELREFGCEYYSQVVKNAKALGQALEYEGFDVFGRDRGYTQSQMLLVDVSKVGGGNIAMEELEKANILVTKTSLWRPLDAIRLGVHTVTRYGMKEDDMKQIGTFIGQVLRDKQDVEYMRKQVTDFRFSFREMRYCYKDDEL